MKSGDKMNCKQCRNLFVNALYDELSAEQKKSFDLHLQECGNCAGEYRKMAVTLKTMGQRAQEQGREDHESGQERDERIEARDPESR